MIVSRILPTGILSNIFIEQILQLIQRQSLIIFNTNYVPRTLLNMNEKNTKDIKVCQCALPVQPASYIHMILSHIHMYTIWTTLISSMINTVMYFCVSKYLIISIRRFGSSYIVVHSAVHLRISMSFNITMTPK